MVDHPLSGATVVVTGASSGIGRGTAIKLAAAGANVVLGARRLDVLEVITTGISDAGGRAIAVATDVSRPDDVAGLAAAAVAEYGRIDVWINNVGIGALGFFWDVPVEDHARVIDVNLKGLVYGAHAAMRQFRAQGAGTLINIGSVESEVPLAYQSSYAASKAGVLAISRALNEELRLAGEQGIRVGTIMPWAIDTPWWTHAANYTGRAARMLALDDPERVVDAIVEACSDPQEEQLVGWKARSSYASHHIFPDLTERMSTNVADAESARGTPVPHTAGSIHTPMAEGTSVDGGIRERMRREDAAGD